MPQQKQFSAAQEKCLKHSLFVASNDLNFSLQAVVHQLICFDAPKNKIISSVQIAAQRMLYITATDAVAGFDMDLPLYAESPGTAVRRMVDSAAIKCAARLYADTLIL
jgi:hypothetical protein